MGDWSMVVPGLQVSRLGELLYRRPHSLLAAHVLTHTAHDDVRQEAAHWQFTPLCAVVVGIDLAAPARTGFRPALSAVCATGR